MARVTRILWITAGLIVAGMICGGLAGALAVSVWLLLLDQSLDSFALLLAAIVGAMLGGIAAPLFAWTMMRRVPLGRMFAVCSGSTMAGGIIGGLRGAVLGCLCATIMLHGHSIASKPKALP